jgi:hypothetical protein
MLKNYRWKGALLLAAGTVLGFGLDGGCAAAVLQRFLVSIAFD